MRIGVVGNREYAELAGVVERVRTRAGELGAELAFDDAVDEDDHCLEAGGVRVVVDPKSALFLKGSTLDFLDGLMESGFKITNPNATSTCGCGQSFGA